MCFLEGTVFYNSKTTHLLNVSTASLTKHIFNFVPLVQLLFCGGVAKATKLTWMIWQLFYTRSSPWSNLDSNSQPSGNKTAEQTTEIQGPRCCPLYTKLGDLVAQFLPNTLQALHNVQDFCFKLWLQLSEWTLCTLSKVPHESLGGFLWCSQRVITGYPATTNYIELKFCVSSWESFRTKSQLPPASSLSVPESPVLPVSPQRLVVELTNTLLLLRFW